MEIISGKEHIEKGSKFLSFITNVNDLVEFQKFLAMIKLEHTDATHHCYAYRIVEPQLNLFGDKVIHEKYSNDGECSGSGKALLNILKDNGLENFALIVVRYFGGVLLGAENVPKHFSISGKMAVEKYIGNG